MGIAIIGIGIALATGLPVALGIALGVLGIIVLPAGLQAIGDYIGIDIVGAIDGALTAWQNFLERLTGEKVPNGVVIIGSALTGLAIAMAIGLPTLPPFNSRSHSIICLNIS